MAKHKSRRAKKSKSLLNVFKHWLEKRGQGLPMTTIVIIVIVLIVLAVVVVFFFGQFSTGQKTVEGQQEIGTSATQTAKCNAWAAGILTTISPDPCKAVKGVYSCPEEARCRAEANKIVEKGTCGVNAATCQTKYGITIS